VVLCERVSSRRRVDVWVAAKLVMRKGGIARMLEEVAGRLRRAAAEAPPPVVMTVAAAAHPVVVVNR
jgi:hypothetical protein